MDRMKGGVDVESGRASTIVWFRRDLRIADHPALAEAVASGSPVVPLFVVDAGLVAGASAAIARNWFLARSLEALDRSLREVGSRLVVRAGRPEMVVPEVAAAFGADVVLAIRDVTPYSHRRDSRVSASLEEMGVRLRLRPGLLMAEPEDVHTATGHPYGVFTPFWRTVRAADRRTIAPAPVAIASPPSVHQEPMGLGILAPQLDLGPPATALPDPGEAAARRRLSRWVGEGLAGYGTRRDELSGAGASRLGQDLHFGLLSVTQVEAAALAGVDEPTPFVRQLAWREFYHHLLFHKRTTDVRAVDGSLHSAFREESDDPQAVAAWRDGRTGIPVVDAAMRQLREEAWMSNRARLIVASFLTRHLLMDPRVGEAHFLRHLIDGDVANNLGGWQWAAGVGSDPQPWFRIFNPVLQGRRFDADGDFVRRWVPELADVPTHRIHAPWEMSGSEAADAGVSIGRDYPAPIIGLAEGRTRALAAFKAATERTRGADGR